jgi:CRISPR system Cascade subunit CasE
MVGKRIGLVTDTERVGWLLRKGEDGGFTVPGAWLHSENPKSDESEKVPNFRVDVIPEGRDRNSKAGHRDGAFVAVRFEGVLEVTDPSQFVKTVHDGVGSAKGFGFGLLSVAPA